MYLRLCKVPGADHISVFYYGWTPCCGPRSHTAALRSLLFFSVKEDSLSSPPGLQGTILPSLFSSFYSVSFPDYQLSLLGMVCRPRLIRVRVTGCSWLFRMKTRLILQSREESACFVLFGVRVRA